MHLVSTIADGNHNPLNACRLNLAYKSFENLLAFIGKKAFGKSVGEIFHPTATSSCQDDNLVDFLQLFFHGDSNIVKSALHHLQMSTRRSSTDTIYYR